jgi:hypothetical protein
MNNYHPMTGADVLAIEVVSRVGRRGRMLSHSHEECQMGHAGRRTREA